MQLAVQDHALRVMAMARSMNDNVSGVVDPSRSPPLPSLRPIALLTAQAATTRPALPACSCPVLHSGNMLPTKTANMPGS